MRFGDGVGSYCIETMPGSPQVAISCHTFVHSNLRGKGLGKEQHKDRLETIQDLCYDYVLCTVRADNAVELHILEIYQWQKLAAFTSSVSDSLIYIYGRRINPQGAL